MIYNIISIKFIENFNQYELHYYQYYRIYEMDKHK